VNGTAGDGEEFFRVIYLQIPVEDKEEAAVEVEGAHALQIKGEGGVPLC